MEVLIMAKLTKHRKKDEVPVSWVCLESRRDILSNQNRNWFRGILGWVKGLFA